MKLSWASLLLLMLSPGLAGLVHYVVALRNEIAQPAPDVAQLEEDAWVLHDNSGRLFRELRAISHGLHPSG